MDIKRVFGQNVKHYRQKAGLTQENLAEKIDMGSVNLGKIETGKSFVTAETLDAISKALKVPPSALFYTPDAEPTGDNFHDKIDSILKSHIASMRKEIRDLSQKK